MLDKVMWYESHCLDAANISKVRCDIEHLMFVIHCMREAGANDVQLPVYAARLSGDGVWSSYRGDEGLE